MKGIRALAPALAAALALAAPSPVAAQDDKVYVNPDSPSGVEYDLPLERARRNSDPAEPGSEIGSREPATVPFGEGIGPADGGASASGAAGGSAGSSGDGNRDDASRKERGGTARRDAPLPPEVAAAAARPVAPADTVGSMLVYAGLGALVVTAGALAGLLLRRRRSRS